MPDLRYHLARALAATGASAKAREHLQRALDSGCARWPARSEAEALLEELE
ncbi:MAG: hypothetical protein U5K33_06520 [Halofilum sp. (in: g-proteobacteria)]|nr:hypothetical protein [Halofilum sp. (in: g-proteobacteria)]